MFPILFPFWSVADNQGQNIGIGGVDVGLFLIMVTVQPGQEFLNFNEFDVVVLVDVVHGVASHGRHRPSRVGLGTGLGGGSSGGGSSGGGSGGSGGSGSSGGGTRGR